MKCPKCQYIKINKQKCNKSTSCHLGCFEYCWIHSEEHSIGRSCRDRYHSEDNENNVNVKNEENIEKLIEKVINATNLIDELNKEHQMDFDTLSQKLGLPVKVTRRVSI